MVAEWSASVIMGVLEFNEFMRAAKNRDEAYFDVANAASVRYTVSKDVQLELKQNTQLHDCCGGIIWETRQSPAPTTWHGV